MGKLRIVHYLNQFYGGIGGEDKADYKPELREGFVGPGMAINAQLKGEAEIVATVICGDSYFNENVEEATNTLMDMIKSVQPDILIAGPAFNAGRYGMACGQICSTVSNQLNIPVVTAMYEENPGAESFKKDVYILATGKSAASMRAAAPAIGQFALKLLGKEEIGSATEEGYFPRGRRKNVFVSERGATRAVNMLVDKIKGESFETEYAMPIFDTVPANPAVKDIKNARIALVTSGGIVPKGNPDRIESSSASKYGKYSIAALDELTEATYETAHGGYDPSYANENPNRVVPIDVLRDMEKEGEIGKLHEYFYSTVGNGTSVASSKAYAENFAQELVADGVMAVILTST